MLPRKDEKCNTVSAWGKKTQQQKNKTKQKYNHEQFFKTSSFFQLTQ